MALVSCGARSWIAAHLENVSYLWGGEVSHGQMTELSLLRALTQSSALAVERDGDAVAERSK